MCTGIETAAVVGLAISAASTVSSVGMGLYSAQQQAAQAQASMNMQAQQANMQMQQQQAQQQMQQQMQYDQMVQAQQQQRNQQIFQIQQQQQQNALQQQQQQQQQALQVQQANVQIANQYNQQRQQVQAEREQLMRKYEVDRLGYTRDLQTASDQKKFNGEAANAIYKQEQIKILEAKKKAAFAQQTALAKSIGARGSILAAGRTGQSVGLLVNDAERQAGFEKAQADATLDSQIMMGTVGMDQAFLQNQNANQTADNNVGFDPQLPYMPSMPGIPNFIDPFRDAQPA